MGLSLTVLGCSATYAAPGGACSGYLLRGAGATVWVDCGPGTLANLQRHLPLGELDAVVVSHVHPDHWCELPVVRNAWKYGLQRDGLPVYTTADVRHAVEAVVDGAEPTFAWHEVAEGDRVDIGGLGFRFSRTDHPVETLAMRIDAGGTSIGYSADTGPGWSPEALGAGLDLFVCEASLLAHQEGTAPHLSGRQAGLAAGEARVGRLLVTHTWPTNDPGDHLREAAAAFDGPVELARVNERYDP
ncbi:MAG: MBL fold metallo-hydrolase [Acidimicrobiales bacterium]|nr:MBL fold metallo-hydrolase [Acidimicrobiales bacterium]